jgi:hypothetical protein
LTGQSKYYDIDMGLLRADARLPMVTAVFGDASKENAHDAEK